MVCRKMKKNRVVNSFRNHCPHWLKTIIMKYSSLIETVNFFTGDSSKQKMKDMMLAVEKNKAIIPTILCIEDR